MVSMDTIKTIIQLYSSRGINNIKINQVMSKFKDNMNKELNTDIRFIDMVPAGLMSG